MDITTLIGIVVGTFLIVNGIGTDKLGNFVDKSSILIVVGGTLAATVASYPLSILMDIPKHIMVLFRGKQYNIPKLVEQLVDLAMIARQSGLLALEEKADEIKDPFFRQSVLMIVDANDPDKVRFVLERELENMMVRHDAFGRRKLRGAQAVGLCPRLRHDRDPGRTDQYVKGTESG